MGKTVEIIGGGFSGLSLAYFLSELDVPVALYEKSLRLGGVIGSSLETWGLVESAATGLLNSDLVERVAQDLKVTLAPPGSTHLNRYIFRGLPRRWPLSFAETSKLALGVARLIASRSARSPKANDTVQTWVTENFGDGAFRYLVAPALQGIYASSDLSAELLYDSLWGKLKYKSSKPSRRGTVAPLGGMQELISAFEQRIRERGHTIKLGVSERTHFQLPTVLAVPATEAAVMLAADYPDLAAQLSKIRYLPITTVTVAFQSGGPKLEGFGCLFPVDEKFNSLGVLMNSSMFANRSSENHQIETWIFSGTQQTNIEELIMSDRKRILSNIESWSPVGMKITRWAHGIPHYNLELNNFRKNLTLPPQLYLTGNYLGRIGLAKILQYNSQLAKQIKSEL